MHKTKSTYEIVRLPHWPNKTFVQELESSVCLGAILLSGSNLLSEKNISQLTVIRACSCPTLKKARCKHLRQDKYFWRKIYGTTFMISCRIRLCKFCTKIRELGASCASLQALRQPVLLGQNPPGWHPCSHWAWCSQVSHPQALKNVLPISWLQSLDVIGPNAQICTTKKTANLH